MQLILSGHVDGLWARAGVGRAGTGIEPNVPVPREEVGHGCEAASHEETGAASHGGACAPGPPPATSTVENVLSPRGLRFPPDD